MKKYFFLLAGIAVASCAQKNVSRAIQDQVMDIALHFARDRVTPAKDTINSEGIMVILDSMVRYVISPASIIVADIDPHPGKEILITIDSLHDPYLVPAYHLILRKKNGKLALDYIIKSDCRIMGIEDGIITADIPTHRPESPLYYCSDCRDTVQYRILNGELVMLR